MRHWPVEPKLRRAFAWIAADQPDLFRAYQASQYPHVEKAMTRAKFVASFVGSMTGRAVFAYLYSVLGSKLISRDQFWNISENIQLNKLGMTGWLPNNAKYVRENGLWFDLQAVGDFNSFLGRLEIEWRGGERNWYRWAHRNVFLIAAIHDGNVLARDMPDWDRLILRWTELQALPVSWKRRLAEWRGIYLIVDESDGRGYVGSAYGPENILGRWENYSRTGHGGNAELYRRRPENFRFSILQRVSPDMDAEDVIKMENRWKLRLHTRDLGLNKN